MVVTEPRGKGSMAGQGSWPMRSARWARWKSSMVDLGGYVIILVETSDKRVKLYGESLGQTGRSCALLSKITQLSELPSGWKWLTNIVQLSE